MRQLEDLVTARALRYGLAPDVPVTAVAEELLAQAHGSRWVLERAIGRIERGLVDRPSRVGRLAREALDVAVRLVGRQPAALAR